MTMLETTADDSLRCYRHPDRETYVRCGRCEQPICTRCSMEGPVGLRCKQCGTPANDPLQTFTPSQLALGGLVALGGGTLGGFVGLQMGLLLSICVGPFIGAAIAEGVSRVTAFKRGPKMRLLIAAGIVAGVLVAAVIQSSYLWGVYGWDPAIGAQAVGSFLTITLASSLLYVAAAIFGAFARIR